MSTNTKPRICEVLGVEVGERFTIDGYPTEYGQVQVCEDGKVRRVLSNDFAKVFGQEVGHKIGANALYYLLSHPERILRQPRFTADEVATMRVFAGAGYVVFARDDSDCLCVFSRKPIWAEKEWTTSPERDGARWDTLPRELFQSILPGTSITLADIIKIEKER